MILLTSKYPFSLICLIIWPLGLTKAETPLFVDLITFLPSSIDLNIEWDKCWAGPIDLPNQPSSEIFNIKS